jgi:DNA-binding NarL/FixJ family response regulator
MAERLRHQPVIVGKKDPWFAVGMHDVGWRPARGVRRRPRIVPYRGSGGTWEYSEFRRRADPVTIARTCHWRPVEGVMTHARILLADDHTLLLDAFRALLAREFDVVGTVTDGRMLLEECARLMPDVVVLDIAMPLLNGLDAGRQLRAQRRSLKLIYLTMNPSPDLAAEALRLGASGYVLKSSAAHELTQAIREALKGRSYITPLVTREVVGSLMQHRPVRPDLTTRQREVLQLLAEGRSMKEAGAILNLTARTVAFHKYRMMEQLRLKTTAELVQFAVRQGVVS